MNNSAAEYRGSNKSQNVVTKSGVEKPAIAPSSKSGASTAESLTKDEEQRLVECEETIQNGLKTMFEVGAALAEIKASKLYRLHGTFEEYCQDVWRIGRIHANRQIDAYECLKTLKTVPIGTVCIPENEGEAREIARLKAPDQIKVAELVHTKVGEGKHTAQDFKQAREQLFPLKKAVEQGGAVKEDTSANAGEAADIIGNPFADLPDHARPNRLQETLIKMELLFEGTKIGRDLERLFTELKDSVGVLVKWESEKNSSFGTGKEVA